MSVCLPKWLSVHESLCLFECSFAYLLACMPVYIYLSICLSVHNFICQYECMKSMSHCLTALVSSYVFINIGLSVCRSLCICLSVRLSVGVCMAACQFVFFGQNFTSVYICFSFSTSNSMSTVCILVYQSVRLTVCLSVCMHVNAHLFSQLAASNRS